MPDDLVEMARLAQHDERMATGALYGDLADRIEELEAKLAKAVEAMQFWSEAVEPDVDKAIALMDATLAELKGEDRG